MTPCVVRRASCVFLALFAACDRSNAGGVPASIRYPDHVAAGGNQPPAAELKNPIATDSATVADGSRIFTMMNCDGCHGGGATGWVAPALNDGRWRYGGSDAAVFMSIYYGRPKGMPAFGGLLQPAIIWKLVSYVQSLPPGKAVPTQAW